MKRAIKAAIILLLVAIARAQQPEIPVQLSGDEIHLRAIVNAVVPLSDFSGEITPVDVDPRFALTLHIESADPAFKELPSQSVVTLAIHSPSLLFAGEPTKGAAYNFILHRDVEDGKVRFFGLRVATFAQHVNETVAIKTRTRSAKQPEAFVRSFYHLVVARHPVSIPEDAEMKVFAPYLSKALLNRIHVARACSVDWERQNPPPPILKPPFGWLESGLFSGGNEKASPRLYHVEKTQLEKDGSFNVYVRLTWGLREKPWIWHVAAIVMKENGRFVVDDVIYLKDEPEDTEWRLSESLAEGCDGTRWVGDSDKR